MKWRQLLEANIEEKLNYLSWLFISICSATAEWHIWQSVDTKRSKNGYLFLLRNRFGIFRCWCIFLESWFSSFYSIKDLSSIRWLVTSCVQQDFPIGHVPFRIVEHLSLCVSKLSFNFKRMLDFVLYCEPSIKHQVLNKFKN